MKKLLIAFSLLFCAVFAGAATYVTISPSTGPFTTWSNSNTEPAAGSTYIDANSGQTIERLTNGASQLSGATGGVHTEYTWDAVSSDGHYGIFQWLDAIDSDGGYVLYDLTQSPPAVVTQLNTYDSDTQEPEFRWDNSGSHPTWLYYRSGATLHYIDVSTMGDTLVHDFTSMLPSGATNIQSGDEGGPSENSRYWAWLACPTGQAGSVAAKAIICYDKTLNIIVSSVVIPSGNAQTEMNNVYVSKSGTYFVTSNNATSGTAPWYGTWSWNFQTGKQVALLFNDVTDGYGSVHQAVAYDAQGNDVLFTSGVQGGYGDEIEFITMSNGTIYPLMSMDSSGSNMWGSAQWGGWQFDAPGLAHKGWGFMETYDITNSGGWGLNQLIAFQLNENYTQNSTTPEIVWRVASAQNIQNPNGATNGYYQQPNPSCSEDGTKVLWGADWNSMTSPDDVLEVQLPSTWYTDFGGTTTFTVAAPSNCSATATSSSTINVTWQNNASNAGYVDVFESTFSATTGFVDQGHDAPTTTSQTFSGLTPNNSYYFEVQASSGTTYSNFSNVVVAYTFAPPQLNAPSGLWVVAASSIATSMGWTQNNGPQVEYAVDRCVYGITTFGVITVTSANATGYYDNNGGLGLTPGTTYSYEVQAYENGYYSSFSSSQTIYMPIPQKSVVSATATVSANTVTTGGTLTFTSTATTTNGTISSIMWNFGDGYTSSSQNTSHQYNNAGATVFTPSLDEYLTCADNASLETGATTDFEMGGWVNLNNITSARVMIAKGPVYQNGSEYCLLYSAGAGSFRFGVANESQNAQVVSSLGTPTLNQWYFVRGWYTHADNGIHIQVSGPSGVVTSSATGIVPNIANNAFYIGKDPAPASYMSGTLCGLYFAKRVSTSGEATALYNSGNGQTFASLTAANGLATFQANLISWWDLNDYAGTSTWLDQKGSNNLTSSPNIPARGTGVCFNSYTANATVTATDSNGNTGTSTQVITVTPQTPPPPPPTGIVVPDAYVTNMTL